MLKLFTSEKFSLRKKSHLRKKEQVSNPPLRADVSAADVCGCFLRLLLIKSCSCAEKLVSSRDSEVCGGRAISNPAVSALPPCSSTSTRVPGEEMRNRAYFPAAKLHTRHAMGIHSFRLIQLEWH